MPDHLHLLVTPGEDTSLEKAVQMIKGGSAFRIRKAMSNPFPIWHQSFHDRWIRDGEEYFARKDYIDQNPIKDGLANKVGEYVFGSAGGRYALDTSQFDISISGTRTSAAKAG